VAEQSSLQPIVVSRPDTIKETRLSQKPAVEYGYGRRVPSREWQGEVGTEELINWDPGLAIIDPPQDGRHIVITKTLKSSWPFVCMVLALIHTGVFNG
jgi:hypothetical protein